MEVSVVADSVNPLAVTRAAWRDVGAQYAAHTVDVEIVCSDPREHRHRVETRPASIPGLRLPTWQDVLDREYQPWDRPPIVIDTATASAAACVSEFLRRASLKPPARRPDTAGVSRKWPEPPVRWHRAAVLSQRARLGTDPMLLPAARARVPQRRRQARQRAGLA
jgi:hypothetical protein